MGSRVLHHPEAGTIGSVQAFELEFVPAQRSVLRFPEHNAEAEVYDEPLSRQGYIRGIRSALAIEAAAALMIYGLWQLSHLLR